MKKTQVVMTAHLARHLLNKGFHIIDLDKHRLDSKMTTFIFEYSAELQEAMDVYFEALKIAKRKNA